MFADPNKHSKITLLSTFIAFCELAGNHKFASKKGDLLINLPRM